jgi:Plasmid pRiA4b ORF-3-like protein
VIRPSGGGFRSLEGLRYANCIEFCKWLMGWENSHLYEFAVGEERFGDPDAEDPETKDSGKVRLEQVVPEPRRSLTYLYDFGDGWQHDVQVDEVGVSVRKAGSAICLDGAGACPPEDFGGIYSFQEVRSGGGQENFDVAATNARLLGLR